MHFSPEAVFTQQTSYLDSTVDDSSRPSAPSVSISCTPVFSLAFIILHCHWPTCLLGSSRNDITLTRPLFHQSLPLGPPVRLTGFQRTLMGGYVQHKSNHTAQMGQKWKKEKKKKKRAAITSKWLARAWWVGCTFHSSPASSFSLWTDCLQEKYPVRRKQKKQDSVRLSEG